MHVMQELAEYFAHASRSGSVFTIAAQTYEPGAPGYDPVTDRRLERLVAAGLMATRRPEARVARAVADLSPAQVGILRLACTDTIGDWHEVASQLPSAIVRGRRIVEAESRNAYLDVVLRGARDQGVSGMVAAQRVLEADRRTPRTVVSDARAIEAIRSALWHSPDDHADLVAEARALVTAAVEAYRAAHAAVGTTKRRLRDREQLRREGLLAELRGKSATKRQARFEARLRGSA